jgi:hypothetical protein
MSRKFFDYCSMDSSESIIDYVKIKCLGLCISFDSSIFYVSLNLGLFVFMFEFVERRGFVVVSI